MKSWLLKSLTGIRKCTSGNATVLLALGTPLLVGGAGVGVDMAQWYTWKRELQFAVDQAAIAGAWARAADSSADYYRTRASQEYTANLHTVADFDSGATVTLANYDTGTNNSVLVTASATSKLPFTAFLTGTATTVSVSAQAIYEPGGVYNPCLLALNKTKRNALKFHGGPNVNSACGAGALSNAEPAGSITGNSGTYNMEFIIVAGTFTDIQDHMANGQIIENARDLEDPYDDLTPPDNPTPRSLSCPGTANWVADEYVVTTVTYGYFIGANRTTTTPFNSYPSPKQNSNSQTPTTVGVTYATEPAATDAQTPIVNNTEVAGRGNDKVWERQTTTVTTHRINIEAEAGGPTTMLPGTYTSFDPTCNLTLAPGIYVIDGVDMRINAQYSIWGEKVIFVLKNGAGLDINGGADVHLTAIDKLTLMSSGVAESSAEKLAGMLIFEDPDSAGGNDNVINGNSNTSLSGVIYTPNSAMSILGSASATSACLQVASSEIEVGGDADLSNMCDTDLLDDKTAVSTSRTIVRLVG